MKHRFAGRTLLMLPAVLLSIATPICAQQVLVSTSTNLLGILDFASFTTTGAITMSQIHNVGDSLICMAYGPDNTLYGLDAAGKFYEVNPTTGTLTPTGSQTNIGSGIVSAAWDGQNTIYVLKSSTQGDGTITGSIESVDISAPFTHQTTLLGTIGSGITAVPDGFMALNKPLASGGTIYIGALDPNRPVNNKDALYKIVFEANNTIVLSHPGGADGSTGYHPITDGVNVNSTLYGFGGHVGDSSANANHSIFTADTSGTTPGILDSYYDVGGGYITGAVVSLGAGVPEASTLILMSLMAGVGGGGLLLRRKRVYGA